jgi:NADH:ubiquinone oxidoreductase subunit C
MTKALSGPEVAKLLTALFPDAVVESGGDSVVLKNEYLLKAVDYLQTEPSLGFNYLNDITSTDYFDYFEIVYRLTSMDNNHTLALKVRCYDRQTPSAPSVTGFWRGADYMEREIFDLMGITFSGHPDLKRILLWEGFAGHPLRKDYL